MQHKSLHQYYEDCMDVVEELIRHAAEQVDALKVKWGAHEIDLSKKFKRRSFLGLINEATGYDLKDFDNAKLLPSSLELESLI